MTTLQRSQNVITDEEIDGLSVRSFTLPLNNMRLLLPSTVVAEVLDFREIVPAEHMPDWLFGMLQWRGQKVPLFCFEKLLGQEPAMQSDRTRHVVCNTLNGSSRIPFIAIQINGLPQLHAVTNKMLTMDSEAAYAQPVVQATLLLQGERVMMPNFDIMEKMLEKLGISAD